MTQQLAKTPQGPIVTYVPLGERDSIELTVERTKNFLATPTKSGQLPTNQDIIKFMMLCKSQELNPWAGDAYLVGYDSKDGPTYSLIASHQSLLKRSEACPAYAGMESGVIVAVGDSEPIERQGDFLNEGERLLGGWAKVYRSDRQVPSYDSLALKTFNTGRSRWAKDPCGMIVKCAEASALRKAFPTQLGGLYNSEEMEHTTMPIPQLTASNGTAAKPASVLDAYVVPASSPSPAPAPVAEPVDKQEVEPAAKQADDPVMVDIRSEVLAADAEQVENLYNFYVGPESPLGEQVKIDRVSKWCQERRDQLAAAATSPAKTDGALFETAPQDA